MCACTLARVTQVYHRGSGERHLVRLPSFPSFEGYTLSELDRADEGELSTLNRRVAQHEDDVLADGWVCLPC